MLSVYARHSKTCKRRDIHYRQCHCPKWIRGILESAGPVRMSAHTRSWENAERKAREIEQRAERRITIEHAVETYLNDEQGRRLKPATLHQKRAFLERQLLPWCKKQRLYRLDQLRVVPLRGFRQTWDVNCTTAARWYERLRSFFAFCLANGWLAENPTNTLGRPVTPSNLPTEYFNRQEFQRIVSATEQYEYGGGRDCQHRATRLRALVLLMRWSGLAIKDAVGLRRECLDNRGALFLRRAKTGVPVFVPLPPMVVSLLHGLPSISPNYFFWSGHGDLCSSVKGYQRSFRKLFRIAGIKYPDGTPKPCHSHMFRDTFAVELLLAGVPIDRVSVLLGHRSVKMTEKHYLPWVKARQKQLTSSVRRAWFPEVRRADRLPIR
jgi:integrase